MSHSLGTLCGQIDIDHSEIEEPLEYDSLNGVLSIYSDDEAYVGSIVDVSFLVEMQEYPMIRRSEVAYSFEIRGVGDGYVVEEVVEENEGEEPEVIESV